jgi:hypothetical protein
MAAPRAKGNAMSQSKKHKWFCCIGQPALCSGYFTDDLLPCVCGVDGTVLSALNQIAIPAQPLPDSQPIPDTLPLSA